MLKVKNINMVNWWATIIGFFSMGYLYGISNPNVPIIIWLTLILIMAVAKIWVHHQTEKIEKAQKQQDAINEV